MAKKVMTVKSEIKRQLEFSIKQDGRADGGYYATLCKFRNEIGGTFNDFLKKVSNLYLVQRKRTLQQKITNK
jgi:hypothetical protein